MTTEQQDSDIVGIECRFATYCAPPYHLNIKDDLHVVKEIIHYKDGTKKPNLRKLANVKRDFYITKKGFQNHEQKKEIEKLDNLLKFTCTQSQLDQSIARALGRPGFQGSYKQLTNNPFVYGSDIPSISVLKHQYQEKWPELNTPFSVACFDTEKDMINGTEEINMATISFKDRIYTAVQKSLVAGRINVVEDLHKLLNKYLSKMDAKDDEGKPITVNILEKRGIKWEVELVDSDIDIIQNCFAKAHEWKPDFVSIWNIDFDIPLMIKSLKARGIDPKDVFSDPSVPGPYRYFKYKRGQDQFTSTSGVVKALKPADKWHTVFTPASFYFIDGMCAYRLIRIADGEEQSYGLDAILEKKLGMRKLKFEQAEHMQGVEWHQFMQSEYPLEYVIYNVFDCVSMEELDESTNDLALQVPMMAGCAAFDKFKSQPTRLVSELHYFCLEQGYVIGTAGDSLKSELDDLTISLKGHITALPAHLVADNGLQVIVEDPTLRTNIRTHVADLDVSAAYPTNGCVFNISKATTWRELCQIENVSEEERRRAGLNFSGGKINAVEICTSLYKLPEMTEWLEAFEHDLTTIV